jgi:NAD(P)-dependent dehydrogenase (short-subunit alcohol dehydrogenase family)
MKGQVVLITGAGSGIGRATAMLLAEKGARVALMGRRAGLINQAVKAIKRRGGRACGFSGDTTREESVQQVVKGVLGTCGRIDVLVNNAGIPAEGRLVHATTDQEWHEIINANLTGSFRMVRAVLPHFMKKRAGIIVNVSSIAGLVGMRRMAAYGVAKSGLIALTRSVAAEYGQHGIRCNCICPGTVQTPMTEVYLADPERHFMAERTNLLGRIGRPSEIAQGILFLASEASAFLTGGVLIADGGYTAV